MKGVNMAGYDFKTMEGRRDWVFDNWETIAAYGYFSYLQHGRCAILITGDANGPDDDPPNVITANATTTEPSEWWDELMKAMEEYDPQDEIVVFFELRDFLLTFGRYGSDEPGTSPPESYDVFMARQGT